MCRGGGGGFGGGSREMERLAATRKSHAHLPPYNAGAYRVPVAATLTLEDTARMFQHSEHYGKDKWMSQGAVVDMGKLVARRYLVRVKA